MPETSTDAPTTLGGGQAIKCLAVQPASYHFEYTAIHAQRLEMVSRADRWLAAGHTLSLGVIGYCVAVSARWNTLDRLQLVGLGMAFATIVLGGIGFYVFYLDNRVRELYPRLISLELLLDFHFYRDFLRRRDKAIPGTVDECERQLSRIQDTAILHKEVKRIFQGAKFPRWQRPLSFLAFATWGGVILGWLVLFGLLFQTTILKPMVAAQA